MNRQHRQQAVRKRITQREEITEPAEIRRYAMKQWSMVRSARRGERGSGQRRNHRQQICA